MGLLGTKKNRLITYLFRVRYRFDVCKDKPNHEDLVLSETT